MHQMFIYCSNGWSASYRTLFHNLHFMLLSCDTAFVWSAVYIKVTWLSICLFHSGIQNIQDKLMTLLILSNKKLSRIRVSLPNNTVQFWIALASVISCSWLWHELKAVCCLKTEKPFNVSCPHFFILIGNVSTQKTWSKFMQ